MKEDKISFDSCHEGGGWEDTSHLTLLCGGAEVWGNLLVPERDFSLPLFLPVMFDSFLGLCCPCFWVLALPAVSGGLPLVVFVSSWTSH